MALVTATHPMAKALVKARKMVALSSEFQAQTGSSDVDEAHQHVYTKDVFGEATPRPAAVVSVGDSLRYGQVGGGSWNYMRKAGNIGLFLVRDTPKRYHTDQNAAEVDAWNFFGQVLDDVADLSAKQDDTSEFDPKESHLPITRIDVTNFGENDEEDWPSVGRFFFLSAILEWGDGSI